MISIDINADNAKPAVGYLFNFRYCYGHKYTPSLVVSQKPVADSLPVVLVVGQIAPYGGYYFSMTVLKSNVVEGNVLAFF